MSAIFETLLAADIPAPAGALRLRREAAEDDAFRFALFAESRPELALLPSPIRETLLRQQFRAQTAGHAGRYPEALFAIVEKGGTPIGRIVLAETAERLFLVDIAFLAAARGRGAGAAVLAAMMAQTEIIGLHVSRGNPGAARLYLRMGFEPVAEDAANIEMEWRASRG